MDIIKNTQLKINELNQRFSLILENFVDHYTSYLEYPKNPEYKREINHVMTTIDGINSDAFLLSNTMESEMNKDSELTRQLMIQIEKLKVENNKLRKEAKRLNRRVLTAEGMFDDELTWYRKQITTIVIMLIGSIACLVFFNTFKLDLKQLIISIAIVIIAGWLFTKLITNILDTLNLSS